MLRGLPLWFSLATYGTAAYTAAIERTLEVTRFAEAEIAGRLVPTSHGGETVARFAIVNPTTTEDDITAILDTMT